MTNSVDKAIQLTLELDKESTKGPWRFSTCYGVATIEKLKSRDPIAQAVNYIDKQDAHLISDYRTMAPKLAAALQIAVEALRDIQNYYGTTYDEDGNTTTARESLSSIERIFDGN